MCVLLYPAGCDTQRTCFESDRLIDPFWATIGSRWRGPSDPTNTPSGEEAGPRDPGMGSLILGPEFAEVVKNSSVAGSRGWTRSARSSLRPWMLYCFVADTTLQHFPTIGGSHSAASLARSIQGYWTVHRMVKP